MNGNQQSGALAAATMLSPGVSKVVGVGATGNGRVVGWVQRRGDSVRCVVRTKEPVVQSLPGFREAAALLREAGAVSLEFVSETRFDRELPRTPERTGVSARSRAQWTFASGLGGLLEVKHVVG